MAKKKAKAVTPKADKPKADKPAAKSTDIPLDNIPERTKRAIYSDEFKAAAVERFRAGESIADLERELNIPNGYLIVKWRERVDAGLPITARGKGGVRKD